VGTVPDGVADSTAVAKTIGVGVGAAVFVGSGRRGGVIASVGNGVRVAATTSWGVGDPTAGWAAVGSGEINGDTDGRGCARITNPMTSSDTITAKDANTLGFTAFLHSAKRLTVLTKGEQPL
jgi:hypothetical protein